MNTSVPSTLKRGRGSLALIVISILLGLIAFAIIGPGRSLAAPEADCTSGNFSGIYQDQDLTLSGDLYVTSNVIIRNNITVTLEAGTNVTVCGEHQISVTGGGNLVAIGTEATPITFDADDPALNWDGILFNGEADHSILRHAVINNGGGNESGASAGAVEFGSNLAANPLPSPTLDQVTINDSGAYGLYLQVNANDATPPSITNVTINNSASGAMLANAPALGGLGSGNVYTNNAPDTIQVISGGASWFYRSQTWGDQGVPYEILGSVMVSAPSSSDPFPTLTIEAGTTFLMHPGATLNIGTSLGRGASLQIEGTAAAPVIFTRLDDVSAPWDKLRLSLYPEARVDLQHAQFSFGGSNGPAAIEQLGDGPLSLDHVMLQNNQSAGLHAQGNINVNNSLFEFNQTGLEFQFSAEAIIRNSIIRNNSSAGLISLDTGSNFTRHCIDAIGNNWGSPDGPAEAYDQADACGQASTNAGNGDSVSGGVLYEPWLPGEDALADRGTIQPDPYYVIADGLDSAQVTITLRDAQGNPLAGKDAQLKAMLGTIVQPTSPTDANGTATAVISSATPGFAYLSAYNLTDDAPVAGLGGVTFWQGSGDGGGLIDPGGAPFASPQLQISGKPFQVGSPVGMRLPMQNSNPDPVDVQVVYGISGLAVGTRFAPVYTATTTLQPGESWDAAGVWLPTSDGHRCIQAILVTDSAAPASILALQEETTTRQKNTDQDPCNPETLDPGPTWLKQLGGIGTIADWFYRLYTLSKKANECLEQTEQWPFFAHDAGSLRDYQHVVTPPAYDPPEIAAEGDLTAEQAQVLNAMAQTTSDLLSLNLAIGATAQRLNWAAQASTGAGSGIGSARADRLQADDDLYYLDLQYGAYRDFANRYADKLDLFADQIGDLLTVLDSEDNIYMLAEDFQKARDRLASSGFDPEEVDFYQQTGLDAQLIDQLAQDMVANFDKHANESTAFATALADIQASSRALAMRLRDQYPTPAAELLSQTGEPAAQSGQLRDAQPATIFVPPQVYDFEVGHPFAGEQTVDLAIRPVNLPLGWTYSLGQKSFTLAEGETAEATLTLYPGDRLLEGDLVQVTVEGSVDGELVGGILMEYLTPSLTPRYPNDIYLPLVGD